MKKLLFILFLAVLPAALPAQVTVTADSNYIKIERTGAVTPVLFCKDLKFGYDGISFYFTNKLSTSGWEYTVRYSEVQKFNSFYKGANGFPTYNSMRDALIEFILKGKSAIQIKT